MLLPLPATISRDRSLGHHLGLAALRAGNCNVELIGRLFRTLYIAYFVYEATNGPRDLAPFRISETALHSVAVCAKTGGDWLLSEGDRRALEHVLLLHDEQLTAMPSHRILEAEERLKRFLATDVLSPITPDDDGNAPHRLQRKFRPCNLCLFSWSITSAPTTVSTMPPMNVFDAFLSKPATVLRHRSRITVRRSPVHGRGVFATCALVAGELICEYLGERISWDEAVLRHPRDPAQPDHTFYFDVGNGTVIDGAIGGNSARWINHACRPNCEAEDRGGRIFIRTLNPVAAGEELSIDYALFVEGRYTRQLRERYACHCGAPDCRRTMLAKRGRRPEKEPISASACRLVGDSVGADGAAPAGIHVRTTIAGTLIDA